jgi:Cu/Ag efflux protein CusF
MLYRVGSLFFVAVALSWVMSVPAQAADSHEGKVVKTTAGKLVMTDMEGKQEHSMKVPASATVTRDGEEAKLSDLKAGDTITVTTETKKGKPKVTKVEAKAAER